MMGESAHEFEPSLQTRFCSWNHLMEHQQTVIIKTGNRLLLENNPMSAQCIRKYATFCKNKRFGHSEIDTDGQFA